MATQLQHTKTPTQASTEANTHTHTHGKHVVTYNWTISTFQERLVVDVNDCRQQILQVKRVSFHR